MHGYPNRKRRSSRIKENSNRQMRRKYNFYWKVLQLYPKLTRSSAKLRGTYGKAQNCGWWMRVISHFDSCRYATKTVIYLLRLMRQWKFITIVTFSRHRAWQWATQSSAESLRLDCAEDVTYQGLPFMASKRQPWRILEGGEYYKQKCPVPACDSVYEQLWRRLYATRLKVWFAKGFPYKTYLL